MHRKLLLSAFEKVGGELNDEGIKSPSVNQCAKKLSSIISESFVYGDRRLRDFHKEAINNPEMDIEIPQQQVLLALATYLGYKDYRDFVNQNFPLEEIEIVGSESADDDNKILDGLSNGNRPPKKKLRLLVIAISLTFLGVLGFFAYHYFNKQQWMEWDGMRYVEASFDSQKLQDGSLKAYKEERITDFKKLIPNCETNFFNDDGSVRVWYGKNKDGILQYFTGYGLHPETGKTLKPITKYMIGKYVCP